VVLTTDGGDCTVKRPFILILLLLLLIAVAHADEAPAPPAEKPRAIDWRALAAMIDTGKPLLLLDNRTKTVYDQGYIPTAVNIPGYLFDRDEVPGLPADRARPIVCYCSGGHCGVSWYVAERLLDLGYEHVFVYDGGVEEWKKIGQMTITARHAKLPALAKADLQALRATGAIVRLLDVRAPREFAAGSLPGAVNLTVENCRPRAEGMPPSLDDLVIVFGQGRWDGRAYHVADRLRAWGYKNVRLYPGGLSDWSKP